MPKKTRTNPKIIGNNYEKEFAKILSRWLTGDEKTDVCWRDVCSGNRATVRGKKGLDTARTGDIVATVSMYQSFFDAFYIDTKTMKDVNLCLINPKNISNTLLQEWIKVVKDAKTKIPMMPVKIRDYGKTPPFILFPNRIEIDDLTYIEYKFAKDNMYYDCILVLQDEFFSNLNWKTFLDINKKIT